MGRRLVWIFAAAAAIRVAFALWAPGVPLSDGRFYHGHAAVLLQTGQYLNSDGSPAIRWMPGWPALLALVYGAFGVAPRAGMLLCGLLDAGTAALTVDREPDKDPAAVKAWILEHATPGRVRDAGSGSPNLLVYVKEDLP